MSGAAISPLFDYSALPADVGAEAKAAASRIKTAMRGAILDVGAELLKIKERLPHGEFGKWLKLEFGLTERSAQNYMAAADLAAKSETVSVLQAKTLYLLAAPSTPEVARQAVIDRLNRGEAVPHRSVKDIVTSAKWEAEQEQKRAKEVQRLASLSPRARRSRAQREAEEARQHEQWRRDREQREINTKTVAQILANRLLPDELNLAAEMLTANAIYLVDAFNQARNYTGPKTINVTAGGRVIAPIDRCTMAIRKAVLDIAEEIGPEQSQDLIRELRDEIDDIEITLRNREARR